MSREERLKAIRERVRLTSPGKWETATDGESFSVGHMGESEFTWVALECPDSDDAAFIAAAREDVPWLLGELERAMAVVEAARSYMPLPEKHEFCGEEDCARCSLFAALAAYDAGGDS